MNSKKFAKRLKLAMEKQKVTQTELSKATNIGKSSISTYLKGEYMPRQEKLITIAKYLHVSSLWLMGFDIQTGPSSTYELSQDEQDRMFNKIVSEAAKDGHILPVGIKNLRDLVEYIHSSEKKPQINFTRQQEGFLYPFVNHCVAAGALTNIEAIAEMETIHLPDVLMGRYARNKSIIIMQVNGESMNRIINHGAFIAVKTDVELTDLHDGDIVVVANAGEYTVKRFYNDTVGQRFIFRPDSDSPAFTDIIFSYDNCDELRLIGRVVMYNVFI